MQKAVGSLPSRLAECTHICNWVSLHNAAPLQKALTMEDVQRLPAVHKMMPHDIHLQEELQLGGNIHITLYVYCMPAY